MISLYSNAIIIELYRFFINIEKCCHMTTTYKSWGCRSNPNCPSSNKCTKNYYY